MRRALAILSFATTPACSSGDDFVDCSTNDDCLQAGIDGVCLDSPASDRQWCAFPDVQCAGSEMRWGLLSGDGLADACVDPIAVVDAGSAQHDANPDGATTATPDASGLDADVTCTPTAGWILDVIDNTGNVGRYNSLAIDGAGTAHATYYDVDNGDLRYATKPRDGAWLTEPLDSATDAGLYSSIALDAMGGLHVTYHAQIDSSTGHELRYAYRPDGEGWQLSDADTTAFTGRYTSVTTGGGSVFVSYVIASGTNGDLWRGEKEIAPTTTWVKAPVVTTDDVRENAIAAESTGAVHIVFDQTSGLRHNFAGGTIPIETAGFPGNPDLALDPAGGAHVSYRNTDLKYAHRPKDGAWTNEVIDSAHGSPNTTAIAIDGDGGIHISYETGIGLYYAHKPPAAAWMVESIDSVGASGESSIGPDPFGGIHVVYRDATGTAFAYAYKCP